MVSFWQSTNGKMVVMALTGVMMFLFVIGHLLGNLLVFAGRARINAYAQFLHFDDSLLWIVRSTLIIAAGMHVVVTIQLALRNKKARPISYLRHPAPIIHYLPSHLAADYQRYRDRPFPACISDTVSLSTFHGFPAREIEGIVTFLLVEMGCHVCIKLNPTLLGAEEVARLLHDVLGYREIQ